MSTVAVYGFEGRFEGPGEHEYRYPELGSVHKCMLFLAQKSSEESWDLAQAECQKFGFKETWSMSFGLLKPEVLNTDEYRRFAAYYEEALQDGSSLAVYPNS
jgi:hypothetical protein